MSENNTERHPIEIADVTGNGDTIKVFGVGGGGGNVVNYIFGQHIEGVGCVAINTDMMALRGLKVPVKVPIDKLGSGCNPEMASKAAALHADDIMAQLQGTEMLFLTAGLGKGTGTGATPVIAKIAHEMGILTLAVVTIPFRFEGQRHIERAINGLQDLRNNVDAILVIANEQIKNQYGNMALRKAFSTADQVIATAIDGISSAVLRSVQVNTDMADMRTTLERSGDMMMGVGLAEGPDRAIMAVRDALDSPLFIEHDMHQAQRIIVSYSYSDPQYEISMDEMSIVNEELESKLGLPDQIWGITIDPTLGEALRITLVVAGLEAVPDDKLREISMGNGIKPAQAMAQAKQAQPRPAQPADEGVKIAADGEVISDSFGQKQDFGHNSDSNTLTQTMVQTEQQKRHLSLSDFDNDGMLQQMEKPINANCPAPERSGADSCTLVGNNPDNPIIHNDYLNDNVD